MRRLRTVIHAGKEDYLENHLDANGEAQRIDCEDDDDGEKRQEARKGRLYMRGGLGEGLCWILPAVLVVMVVYDFVTSAWFEPEAPLIEAHAFGTKAGLRSEEDAQMLVVELKCMSSRGEKLYVHDVDELGRCTADDSLMHHERAWERRVVDRGAGWFTLRSLATRRWLAQGSHAVETRETADVLRDPKFHWRFRPDEYSKSPTRNLENRATETRVEVVDLPSRPGSLLIAGWPSAFALRILSQTELEESVALGEAEARAEKLRLTADMASLRRGFAKSNYERRVISMGLYGSTDKYTVGAIRNAELVDAFFPGWTLRVYADRHTVPNATILDLRKRGADVRLVRSNRHAGAAAGMFWRFLVADDPSVDRFIVRDSDSRFNRRDAFAVLDWIRSGKPAHSLRDHPNHDRPLNGGMWGATNQSLVAGRMRALTRAFNDHDSYGADLNFLDTEIYPLIADEIYAHDAYTCRKYAGKEDIRENARNGESHALRESGSVPFPTKRPRNFQHVGQVFDENDRPRMDDIDSFLRGHAAPRDCRGNDDWVFG